VSIAFLSPECAALGLAAVLPLAAIVSSARRAARVRAVLGLSPRPASALAAPLAGVVSLSFLVALAAAQPVVTRAQTVRARVDAEVFVVLDVSRSMLASRRPGGSSRLERAKAAALALRASLPGVPVGIASLTDRVLPHLFPTTDELAYRATLRRSVGIERPPPQGSFLTTATRLDALGALAARRFFSPNARHRVAVVLTDGESLPVAPTLVGRTLRRPPAVVPVLVHVWKEGERVYTAGVPEAKYRPDPSARVTLEAVAAASGGVAVGEEDLRAGIRAVRRVLGRGPTAIRGERRSLLLLSPYLVAVAVIPLALVLGCRKR